jgi:predicted metal-binding protein
MHLKDLVLKKFSRLTVVSRADKHVGGRVFWNCKCDCGNHTKSYHCWLNVFSGLNPGVSSAQDLMRRYSAKASDGSHKRAAP